MLDIFDWRFLSNYPFDLYSKFILCAFANRVISEDDCLLSTRVLHEYLLFSQRNKIGKLYVPAIFSDSCNIPSSHAPSPKYAIVLIFWSWCLAANASLELSLVNFQQWHGGLAPFQALQCILPPSLTHPLAHLIIQGSLLLLPLTLNI